MNRYEQAVINAAEGYIVGDGDRGRLALALHALDKHRKEQRAGSLDAFAERLKSGADARAMLNMRRVVARSGNGRNPLGTDWPEPIRTAEDFGELPGWFIRDIRNAGPITWRTWSTALRAIGIEPSWAEEVGA